MSVKDTHVTNFALSAIGKYQIACDATNLFFKKKVVEARDKAFNKNCQVQSNMGSIHYLSEGIDKNKILKHFWKVLKEFNG